MRNWPSWRGPGANLSSSAWAFRPGTVRCEQAAPSAVQRDRRGLSLSTASEDAADRYRGATELFLLGRPGARDAFAAAAAIDPSCAEAHTGLAFAALFEGETGPARSALAAAEANASTDRARG